MHIAETVASSSSFLIFQSPRSFISLFFAAAAAAFAVAFDLGTARPVWLRDDEFGFRRFILALLGFPGSMLASRQATSLMTAHLRFDKRHLFDVAFKKIEVHSALRRAPDPRSRFQTLPLIFCAASNRVLSGDASNSASASYTLNMPDNRRGWTWI